MKLFQDRQIVRPIKYNQSQIGRNELCPCGSKKKYKHCCLGTIISKLGGK